MEQDQAQGRTLLIPHPVYGSWKIDDVAIVASL